MTLDALITLSLWRSYGCFGGSGHVVRSSETVTAVCNAMPFGW